jgi:hypothetical protein
MTFREFLKAVLLAYLKHGIKTDHLAHLIVLLGAGALIWFGIRLEDVTLAVAAPLLVFLVAGLFGALWQAYQIYYSEFSKHPTSPQDKDTLTAFWAGRWRIPDEGALSFVLKPNLKALRLRSADDSLSPEATGDWKIEGNGYLGRVEARIEWSDGWRDALKLDNGIVRKIAWAQGNTWHHEPFNNFLAFKDAERVLQKTP